MKFHTELDAFVSLPLACGVAMLYVALVLVGQEFLSSRAPLMLSTMKIAYNIMQIVACSAICYYLAPFFITAKYNYGIGMDNNPIVEWWVWIYYCCKILDLGDTLFIVLEKKTRQLSFLHIWHHSSIVPVFAFYLSTGMGGTCVGVLPFWNSLVHILMYGHYLFMSLNPKFKAWWKPLLTASQIGHHCLILTYMVVSYSMGYVSTPVALCGSLWGVSILLLFLSFYIKEYLGIIDNLVGKLFYISFSALLAAEIGICINSNGFSDGKFLELPLTKLLPICLIPWVLILHITWLLPASEEFKQQNADCILCSCHSIVATLFGAAVWRFEQPQCELPDHDRHWIRFVMILSLAFFCTDFSWMLIARVWKRWQPIDVSLLGHHCLIGFIFAYALRHNTGMWFVSSLLVNELSSLPLSVVFILRYFERTATVDYFLVGFALFVCFFFCRIVIIPYCVWCFWTLDLCHDSFGSRISHLIMVNFCIIYGLNCIWFTKLAKKALKSAKYLLTKGC